MARRSEEIPDRRFLDDASRVHHVDTPQVCGDNAEVVAHEENGHLEAMLQIDEEAEDLCLYRDVERARRFVREQQLRLAD